MPSSHGVGKLTAPAAGTQVLRRSHDMLRLLAVHDRTGLRVSDIAEALGLEPPTAHRIAQGLVQERMAVQDAASKRYYLGPALYELGLTAASRYPLRDLAQPSVDRLAKETGDTIVLTVRSGLDGVCIDRRRGEFPIQTSMVSIGTRRPLAAGAGGLAILSCIEAGPERDWLIAQNAPRLGRGEAELAEQLDAARRDGYAVNRYSDITPPIHAFGVPVLGAFGQCVAGLAVVALANRLSGKRKAEVLDLLRAEARRIGDRLASGSLPNGA